MSLQSEVIIRYNYTKPAGGSIAFKESLALQLHETRGRIYFANLPRGIGSTSRGLIDHKTHMCRCNQRVIIRYNYTKPAGGFEAAE